MRPSISASTVCGRADGSNDVTAAAAGHDLPPRHEDQRQHDADGGEEQEQGEAAGQARRPRGAEGGRERGRRWRPPALGPRRGVGGPPSAGGGRSVQLGQGRSDSGAGGTVAAVGVGRVGDRRTRRSESRRGLEAARRLGATDGRRGAERGGDLGLETRQRRVRRGAPRRACQRARSCPRASARGRRRPVRARSGSSDVSMTVQQRVAVDRRARSGRARPARALRRRRPAPAGAAGRRRRGRS